ncbi:hypothetical protein BFU36_10055 [Sulfolobus sp. A20]|uniref:hypothetical protein n=1 Tax=Sulfolobaceae TaxID=118883 RepID=UPI000846063D|nr:MULTISPECIES: hypothetical protein [unclassified Sulfolobus]TRM76674.1 hypothetical protein DJ523_00615 [Sulfolobus sp. E5]TRM77914.1 hypothetical protein DJ528_05865 [Sulfolobus sp. B5]TRM77954.1 hypothetical protein DJ532_02620 [Sulfolobus sp. A20-N-F8]TRM85119.1 hypothetical protein DJ522_01985 [Sulfolobus sp. F3]TRM89916.1 hypothetical protein DJ526_07960 [Sulfolobus sp. A20-N-G8]TRN02240.1 hypothetical protein DJ527_04130 [Sulfolobus sp. F1]TRN04104.1 hypothetical protein DJ530_01450
MKAIERLNETIGKINEINESELSISEVDLLKFLKNQMMKSKNLFEAFSRSIDQKDWDNVLSYTFQILQRSNSIFGYLTQPTVLSLVSKSRLAGVIDNISDTLAFSVSEMIVVLKQNNKVLNIDSITINISSNPPSLSVSLVIKGG